MNVLSTCASSTIETTWHSINWPHCYRAVKKLQIRIVKATQEGRWGKAKSLQRLLTHSFYGKAISIRRVTENQGKNTPGVDGVTWSTPARKFEALLSLKHRKYKPKPLKRVYIPKSNGKLRPLNIPVMKCRAMQALHLLALEPIAETLADKNSYGFRPHRATADAMEQCFNVLHQKTAACWVLEGDIKGCFDNISHDWILKNIPTDKTILRKWLKAGYIDKQTLFATETGTPQGGIISPVLANMTLDGMETLLQKHFSRTAKIHFIRYADDFIITGCSKETLEQKVKPLIEKFLAERGLILSPEKTKITSIETGFDFLGFNVRKYKGKLLIKPSKKNIKTFLDKIRKIIQENKTAKQSDLIKQLNPIIKGWADYHKHVVSNATFNWVDYKIYWVLKRWAVRRHPKKNTGWIKEKYFKQIRTRNNLFAVKTGKFTSDGKPELLIPRNAGDTKIKRHTKIRGDANPYDPQWEIYFEERWKLKIKNALKENWKLTHIWINQQGLCPICQQKIVLGYEWHVHHIQPRCEGGKDNISNLVMVHPNCHRQIHSQQLTAMKPVSRTEKF